MVGIYIDLWENNGINKQKKMFLWANHIDCYVCRISLFVVISLMYESAYLQVSVSNENIQIQQRKKNKNKVKKKGKEFWSLDQWNVNSVTKERCI